MQVVYKYTKNPGGKQSLRLNNFTHTAISENFAADCLDRSAAGKSLSL